MIDGSFRVNVDSGNDGVRLHGMIQSFNQLDQLGDSS